MVPENIHTHPKDGHWKIRGGEGLKTKLSYFLRESMKQNWKTKKQLFEVLLSNDRQTLNAARNENDESDVSCDAFPPMK